MIPVRKTNATAVDASVGVSSGCVDGGVSAVWVMDGPLSCQAVLMVHSSWRTDIAPVRQIDLAAIVPLVLSAGGLSAVGAVDSTVSC